MCFISSSQDYEQFENIKGLSDAVNIYLHLLRREFHLLFLL